MYQAYPPAGAAPGRIRASIEIVKASWAVLRHDKSLIWLPVLSFLATAVTVALFAAGIFAVSDFDSGVSSTVDGSGSQISVAGYVLMFLLYLALAIITVFFNAALVSAAHERLTGGDPTIESALAGATHRFGALLPWAIVSATVSTILKSIQERSGLLGRIVVGFVGMAWALVTFLVLPIIVVEGLSVGDAIRRSKDLFKRTWGEQVVGNVGIGLVGVLAILAFAPVAVAAFLLDITALTIAVGVAWALWAAVVIAVSSAMSGIFQTALYLYASTGTPPAAYSAAAVQAAFKPGRGARRLG